MGTSSKKTNTHIKKMLSETSQEQFESCAPQITAMVRVKRYLDPNSVNIAVGVGSAAANQISSGSGGDWKIENLDPKTPEGRNSIADAVLDKINEDNPELQMNDILRKAFKLAMVASLLEEDTKTEEFAENFTRALMDGILEAECGEAIIEAYGADSRKELINSLMSKIQPQLDVCVAQAFQEGTFDANFLINSIEDLVKGTENE